MTTSIPSINVYGKWHYKLLDLFGSAGNLDYQHKNSCQYFRSVGWHAFWLAVLIVLTFQAAYSMVYGLIVIGIFFANASEWSMDLLKAATSSLPTIVGVFVVFELIVVGVIVALCAIFGTHAGYVKTKQKLTGAIADETSLAARISAWLDNSSTIQIIKAWHNKICVPIVAVDPSQAQTAQE